MNSTFQYELAKEHGEALRRDAQRARLAREARTHRRVAIGHSGGPKRRLVAATFALAAAAGLTGCASSGPVHHASANALGVRAAHAQQIADDGAGSGRGAEPRPRSNVVRTPNECIRANGGDYNACNVGNSGRGDLPYRPVTQTSNREQNHSECRPSSVEHAC